MSGATLTSCAETRISAIRTIGILCLALAAGCAGVKETPPHVMARSLIVDPSLNESNGDGAVEVIGNDPVAGAPAPPSTSPSAAKAAPWFSVVALQT